MFVGVIVFVGVIDGVGVCVEVTVGVGDGGLSSSGANI